MLRETHCPPVALVASGSVSPPPARAWTSPTLRPIGAIQETLVTATPTGTSSTSTVDFHIDRRSNVVTIDGTQHYPEHIEHILIGHPGVADAAVIADSSGQPANLTAVVQPQSPPQRDSPGGTDLAVELVDYYADQSAEAAPKAPGKRPPEKKFRKKCPSTRAPALLPVTAVRPGPRSQVGHS